MLRQEDAPAVSPRELPRSPASLTVAGLILEYLKGEGVGVVFGIPGGPVTPLFDALYHEPAIRTVAARHEAGAAFMALGAARATGRLGVCCLTTGPGATNAITAVAAAKADSLPVLVLTAQTATTAFGKGSLQDSTESGADTVALYRPITKMSAMLAHPHNAASLLRQALRAAMSGRRGPVHLSVPTDLMRQAVPDAGPLLPTQYRPRAATFDREAVKECAALLLAARRPAILAGHGLNLAGAQAELLELAELLSIPVATTPKGKGAFPETHPLSLRVFGMASSPLSERYLLSGSVDVLLVLGSSLHENSTQGWDPRLAANRTVVQQDIDPAMIGRNYPVTAALAGDARTTLRELLFQLRRLLAHGEHPCSSDLAEFRRAKAEAPAFLNEAAMSSAAEPIKPQRLMRELDAALPEDALVFLDVGNNTLWAVHYLTATGRNAFAHNWGEFAAMGYGVAAAVGAKLSVPRRPVVAVVGDGGFAMSGMEVSTAVTENIPVVWVVLNDSRLNAIFHGQTLIYAKRTIGCVFQRMDIAKIAEGLGAVGRRVVSPAEIGPALRDALASGRPTVLDVWIDADEVPPILSRVRSVGKFVGGMSA
ncbi:MAG TPA: thiamine pyrophosphate-binding protein [Elusimicrobiota bacterium]|jgi:acetolactate synthase-1/2/3 large subunit|nr:thiamine pyrophosphate-binding protein [Elusimicrobiota bacterium]